MPEKLSKRFERRLDKIDPIGDPGTVVFVDEAAMGIIKVVSQAQDQIEDRSSSQGRKSCQVSLLSWEPEHRTHGHRRG